MRLPEIDFLRGLAILAMIFYHLLFDLNYFAGFSLPLSSQPMQIIANVVRITFIGLVGVSLWLSFVHSKNYQRFMRKQLQRVALIGLAAGLVSLTTYLLAPGEYIQFGVLHLIATSILICIPLVRYPKLAGWLGLSITTTGFFFFPIVVPLAFLKLLGLVEKLPVTDLDYFPLFPWLGVLLLGIFFANYCYGNSPKPLTSIASNPITNFIQSCGKHSLLIYLTHQPILIGSMWLVTI